MKTIAALLLVSSVALARPHIPTPTWRELLAGDLVARARVRWVQVSADGQRTVVEIQGGEAYRTNPGLSNQAQPLKYDLARNRQLEKVLKAASWSAPNKRAARENDRTLELLGEGDSGWVVVGSWTAPLKNWQKGKWAPIADELEPLMKVQADVFGTMKTVE